MSVVTLIEWLGEGAKPVDEKESTARATICTKMMGGKPCPMNDMNPNGWIGKVKSEVAKAIIRQIEARQQLKLSTPYDEYLGTCVACECVLELKVHVPMKHILSHTSDTSVFHERCWIRNP